MKIIAKFPVELNGHIYHKGETCDYHGALTRRIADNFTAANGDELTETPVSDSATENYTETPTDERSIVDATIDTMGRDGIRRALDDMNVTYPPKAKTEYLAKLLLASRGEIEL